MDFNELVAEVVGDTQASLWPAFAPEILLCATIFALLIVRCFTWGKRIDLSFPLVFFGIAYALFMVAPWEYLGGDAPPRTELFTGMVVLDGFTAFIRGVLLGFGLLFLILTRLTGVPAAEDCTDFYCLIVGALLGMCLMASANHILMVFLAVEMASIPSYVLAGLLKTRRPSSEAALKYAIYGAGAAGVMLYGISLLTGVLNTAHLPSMARQLALVWNDLGTAETSVLTLGALMLGVGLAFKLSAVPFHFWCPDVFEGATAEVGAFLSIASKAGALALLVRVAIGLSVVPGGHAEPVDIGEAPSVELARRSESTDAGRTTQYIAHRDSSSEQHSAGILSTEEMNQRLAGARQMVAGLIGLLAIITCSFGNLAAYGQTNIKRLMAYSTIAHAGYMMMAVPAAVILAVASPSGAQHAIASLALYIVIYVFMNLGVFAVIALLRNSLGTEEIDDYAGLVRNAPVTVTCLALMLFSLVGLPPLAGFMGKFAIFSALVDGWNTTGSRLLMLLLLVGGLNTAISLFYYLRVVKVMTIDRESDATPPRPLSVVSPLAGCFIVALTIPIVAIIVVAGPLHELTLAAAAQLF